MRALVVYESMYGNTRTIAEAVAEGLATTMVVELVAVEAAPTELPTDLDLLVVGGPTHAFGLSRASTRESVATEVGHTTTAADRGLREWLDELRRPDHRPMVATFSTRVRRPRVPGSAARKAEKRLRRLHLDVVRAATDFWVVGSAGPLADGETTRALHWGEGLAAELAMAHGTTAV